MPNEFEGYDRREHQYSNIQHPFFLKPEFVVSSFFGAIASVVLATIWFTNYVGSVEDIANNNKTSISNNTGEIAHVKELTTQASKGLTLQMNEIKSQQIEMKRDINKRLDRVQGGIDVIVKEGLRRQ